MPASQLVDAVGADSLRPQRSAGLGRGALLALLVHGGLLVALVFGMRWRSSEPTGATAELWAAPPQVAAPVVAPVPQPVAPPEAPRAVATERAREADIAIERERRERERERERAVQAEAERQRQALQQAQRQKLLDAKAEQQRQDRLRQDNLQRMLGQAGTASEGPATPATGGGPSAGYAGRIVARIKPNIVFTDALSGDWRAEVEVRAAPDGRILSRRLVQPSGNPEWDAAVLRAIDRTETLPRDVDGRVPSPITIGFTP